MGKFKLFKSKRGGDIAAAKREVLHLGITRGGPIDAQHASSAPVKPPSDPEQRFKVSSKGAPYGKALDAPGRMVKPKPDAASIAKGVASPSARMDAAGREALADRGVASKPGGPAPKKPRAVGRKGSYHGSPRDWRNK